MPDNTPKSVAPWADEAPSHVPQERYDALRGGRVLMGADTIAELAGLTGREVDRIRDAEVLPPAGGKGKRTDFSPSEVIRLLLIMNVKRAGASLDRLRQLSSLLDERVMKGLMFKFAYGIGVYLVWDFGDVFDIMDMLEVEAFFRVTTRPWLCLCINNVAEAAYRAMGREHDADFLAQQREKVADDLTLCAADDVRARRDPSRLRYVDPTPEAPAVRADSVSIPASAAEISLPLWPARRIKIAAVARDGGTREWYLKTTKKGGLGLL